MADLDIKEVELCTDNIPNAYNNVEICNFQDNILFNLVACQWCHIRFTRCSCYNLQENLANKQDEPPESEEVRELSCSTVSYTIICISSLIMGDYYFFSLAIIVVLQ